MSQEFQLQLIRKTLEELGHSPVADLLAERLSSQLWSATSGPRSLISAVLDSINGGDYKAALAVLQGRNDEFNFQTSSAHESVAPSPQLLCVASYLVLRSEFLEKVLANAMSEPPVPGERELVEFLTTKVADAYSHIDRSDHSVPFADELARDHEGAVLLPLAMTPTGRDEVESAIFGPEILLTRSGPKSPPSGAPDFRYYSGRLRSNLTHLLRMVLGPHDSNDAGLSISYSDLPENCLQNIIHSASQYNLSRSLYYLPPRTEFFDREEASISLAISPNASDVHKDDLPIHLLHTLTGHTDEVWFTRFSPLGRYLATGSLDGTCIIYDVLNNFKTVAELDANNEDEDTVWVEGTHRPGLDKKKGIISLCWEPHERYIVTSCLDTVVRVWRVENITQSKRITRSMDDGKPVSLVSCFTLGERMRTWPCEFLHYEINMTPHFIIGSPDKVLKVFSVEGQEVMNFYSGSEELTAMAEDMVNSAFGQPNANPHSDLPKLDPPLAGNGNGEAANPNQFNRINDFAITPNGKVLITANNDKQVYFYRIPNLFDPSSNTFRIALLSLNGRLTSCSVSANGKYMLLSIAPEELQVWDISPLENYEKPFLKQKFLGQSQALYMVRSCFGYLATSTNEEQLVLSGSDDGYVYIWKLQTGQLITRVRAHHGLCNSVDWNRFYKPTKQGRDYGSYWCSVGDDKLVKIWGPRN